MGVEGIGVEEMGWKGWGWKGWGDGTGQGLVQSWIYR